MKITADCALLCKIDFFFSLYSKQTMTKKRAKKLISLSFQMSLGVAKWLHMFRLNAGTSRLLEAFGTVRGHVT